MPISPLALGGLEAKQRRYRKLSQKPEQRAPRKALSLRKTLMIRMPNAFRVPFLVLLALLPLPVAAQQGRKLEYKIAYDSTLTSTARVLTIQVAASNPRFVLFSALSIYCENQCEAVVERDGT